MLVPVTEYLLPSTTLQAGDACMKYPLCLGLEGCPLRTHRCANGPVISVPGTYTESSRHKP